MSICIYPVLPGMRPSLGARTALQPLAPFKGLHYHHAPWGLNRPPRDALQPPIRPGARPDALLRSAFPTAVLPRELAGSLTVQAAAAGVHTSVSTPIPFPFTLTNITLHQEANGGADFSYVQLLIIDNDPGADDLPLIGTPIYLTPERTPGFGADTRGTGIPFLGGASPMISVPVPQIIIEQPGRRIALRLTLTSAILATWKAIYTVREHLPYP